MKEDKRDIGDGIAPDRAELRKLLDCQNHSLLSHEEVLAALEGYFLSCTKTVEDGGTIQRVWQRPPTKSGIANALGIDRQTLHDYLRGKDSRNVPYDAHSRYDSKRRISTADFALLRRAISICEEYYESKLAENRNPAGCIFWLLNADSNHWSNDEKRVIEYRKTLTPVSASELPDLGQRIFVPAKDVTNETSEKYLIPQIKSQEGGYDGETETDSK